MKNEHSMPDFLPSRYSSWLELYLEASDTLKKIGQQPDDLTEIVITQFESQENSASAGGQVEAFTCRWPFYIVKSRALDELLLNLPNYTQLTNFLNDVRFCTVDKKLYRSNNDFIDVVNRLQKLVPKNFRAD